MKSLTSILHQIHWTRTLLITFFCVLGLLFAKFKNPSLHHIHSNVVLPNTILSPSVNPICKENGSFTHTNGHQSQVVRYSLSSDPAYHYEFRYELQNPKSNEFRLILLLSGIERTAMDWWTLSVERRIVSAMLTSGYSVLAISSKRRFYDVNVPIDKNLDIKWIYLSLQRWINEIYHQQFQQYPRLYLYGLSRGARFAALLSRVLPVQAQILYIMTGNGEGLLTRSDYDSTIRTRLTVDPIFSNWFYFHYCYFNGMLNVLNDLCPFRQSCLNQITKNFHSSKNYRNSVPPTYFVHLARDSKSNMSKYEKLITHIRNDSVRLRGTLLNHTDALKLYVVHPLEVSPFTMQEYFDKWACKPSSSKLFYEHYRNIVPYNITNTKFQTCQCIKTDFTYFERFPNITMTWAKKKQDDYRDYVTDIKKFRRSFCDVVCGDLSTYHAMTSRNIENTLSWIKDMDSLRHSFQIQDFLSRPLRIWMYDKYSLLQNSPYLHYQTADRTSCGRNYQAFQMYSPEYFLQDYFIRLSTSSHLQPLHNMTWADNPLIADYFIIPNDYTCIYQYHYRPAMENSEYKALHIRLNTDYFLPLLNKIRFAFPYWSMTSGSNHIIPFTIGKNMGLVDNSEIQNILKHTVQLGLTGFRQDLLPPNSPPLYLRPYRNVTTIYRHGYDIVIPPFNKLQFTGKGPIGFDAKQEYKKKKRFFFFGGTLNNSISSQSARMRLLSLAKDIEKGTIYKQLMIIEEMELKTMTIINGHIPSETYVKYIRSTIFNLCPEGFSPWSPRLYESMLLGAIPLILADSIVLPFERFIDWRSFTIKINVTNVKNMINLILTKTKGKFEEYVNKKLENVKLHSTGFLWPYSVVDDQHPKHVFLHKEDLNGTAKNVFHYLSLELRCRHLEQFYGLSSNTFSFKSVEAQRKACKNHPKVCPCHDQQQRLAFQEYI